MGEKNPHPNSRVGWALTDSSQGESWQLSKHSLGVRRMWSLLILGQRGCLAAAQANSSLHPLAVLALGAGNPALPWTAAGHPPARRDSRELEGAWSYPQGGWGACVFIRFLLEKVGRVLVHVLAFQLAWPSLPTEVERGFGQVLCERKGSKPEPWELLRDAVGEGCGNRPTQLLRARLRGG